LGYIAHCKGCLYRIVIKGLAPSIPEQCPVCGGNLNIGGPLWCGDMYDADFVTLMINTVKGLSLNTANKTIKLLNKCLEESNAPQTHYEIHKVCKNLKTSAPPILDVMDKLREDGFFVSRTHFSPTSLKTNANIVELKRIIKYLKI
jgi:tRNA (guanine26-N2/guanine27-N2)-dimethyltransferase